MEDIHLEMGNAVVNKKGLHQRLGKYLKEKRVHRGLTQQQVANELGYSSSQFISNFERGLCSPPLKNLRTLVDLYGLPPSDLIEIIIEEQKAILNSALGLSGTSTAEDTNRSSDTIQ